MKELLFIHKIPVGKKSPQRAKESILSYIDLNAIKLDTARAINVYIPLRGEDSEASLECIHCGDIDSSSIPVNRLNNKKERSDIIINKLIADHDYDSLLNNVLPPNNDFTEDMERLKESMNAQVSIKHFNDIIGISNPIGFNSIPIGFYTMGASDLIIVYYVENELGSSTKRIFSKTLTKDLYYEYLSAVYKDKIEASKIIQ